MRWTVLALLLLVPLAGCLDSEPLANDPAGMTAMEARGVADGAALRWDAGARLGFVYGFEDQDANRTEGAAPQERLGDGRAVAWSFLYEAPGQEQHYNVTVAGDGRILFEREEGDGGVDDLIDDWRIDSDDAVRILRDDVAGFADRLDAGSVEHLDWFLVNDTVEFRGVVWGALEFSTDDVHIHVLDATNGTLLLSQSFRLFFSGGVPAEFGSFSGTLDTVSPATARTFQIEEAHTKIGVRFETSPGAPLAAMRFNLTDPDGHAWEETLAPPPGGTMEDTIYLDLPRTGTWTVAVVLESGVRQDYRVDWCTTGEVFAFDFSPFSGHPCDRVDP